MKYAWMLATLSLSVWFGGCADDEPEPKVGRLFIVDSSAAEPYTTARGAMMARLAELGWVEGRNLEIAYHAIDNDEAAGREVLALAPDSGADLVVVNGTVASRAARAVLEGQALPVVFTSVTDPIGEQLVTDFDIPPPANITGVAFSVPVHNRFNVIKRRFPKARDATLRIGLVHSSMPQSRGYKRLIEEAMAGASGASGPDGKTYARLAGMEFHFREVPFENGPGSLERMVAAAREQILALDEQVDLFVSPSDILGTEAEYAQMVAATATRPLVGLGRADVVDRWGALASVYPSVPDIGIQAAEMVDRLLDGEPVSAVFPSTPQRTGYALDLDQATRFGFQVTDEVLELIRPEDIVGGQR